MTNALKQLYLNYCEKNPNNYLVNSSLKKLLKIDELENLTDILIEGIEKEKEKTFYAGFKTGVQLLMGGGLS